MNKIESAWQNFRKQVINRDAGETQLSEMKLAFFAGGFVTFGLATNLPEDEDGGDEQAMVALSTLNDELENFLESCGKPAAH